MAEQKGMKPPQITNDLFFTIQVSNGTAAYGQHVKFVSLPQDCNSSHIYFSSPCLKILLYEPL